MDSILLPAGVDPMPWVILLTVMAAGCLGFAWYMTKDDDQ